MATLIERARKLRAVIEQAADKALDDETALDNIELFPVWTAGEAYEPNARLRHNEKLYRCVQAHTAQEGWEPPATPALWTEVSLDEWPEWKRPTGAQDAYNKGDKVTYLGDRYVSTIDGNTWSPAEYPAGWEKQ